MNLQPLRDAIIWAEKNPEFWNQRDWRRPTECGTAYCIGGYVAVQHGFPEVDRTIPSWMPWIDGQGRYAGEYAQEVLGIDQRVADILFYSGNTLDDLKAILMALEENPDINAEDLELVTEWGIEAAKEEDEDYDDDSYCYLCDGPCEDSD